MSTSSIAQGAKIGAHVRIGDFCKIHDNVVIEDDCTIDDYTTLGIPTPRSDGSPLVIGKGSLIRSYSAFYAGSELGANLRTGHRVTVREGTVAGQGVQLGTLCDLQGHQRIGHHVRAHSSVPTITNSFSSFSRTTQA